MVLGHGKARYLLPTQIAFCTKSYEFQYVFSVQMAYLKSIAVTGEGGSHYKDKTVVTVFMLRRIPGSGKVALQVMGKICVNLTTAIHYRAQIYGMYCECCCR